MSLYLIPNFSAEHVKHYKVVYCIAYTPLLYETVAKEPNLGPIDKSLNSETNC